MPARTSRVAQAVIVVSAIHVSLSIACARQPNHDATGATTPTRQLEGHASAKEPGDPKTVASERDDPEKTESTEQSPVPAEPQLARLPVPGFSDAVVSIPGDTSEPRPLFIMAHGAGGGPEFHCEMWRRILDNKSFVLCPRGDAIDHRDENQGYYYKNHIALEKEFVAAVAAMQDQFGDRLDLERAIYAGYSQGATMGSLMIPAHGERFSRLLLIEGGFSEWNLKSGRTFKAAGGERVLFACGTRHCYEKAKRSAAHLESAGVATRVEHAAGAGHTFLGEVRERVLAALGWLFDDDERFR